MHAGDLAGKHTLIAGEASMTCRTSGGVGDGVSEGAVVQLDGIQVTCGLAAPVLCQVSACYVLGGCTNESTLASACTRWLGAFVCGEHQRGRLRVRAA